MRPRRRSRGTWRRCRPSPSKSCVLAVAGPTASGKSALVHRLARRLGGEIIVADPFQRYRGLEIAADAPSQAERDEVPYHCVGDLLLTTPSTVADFAITAHRAIDACMHAESIPLVSGGTGLYLRAALAELAFPPGADAEVAQWAERLAESDLDAANAALDRADPSAEGRVDRANPRRVARALAIATAGERLPPTDGLWDRTTRLPTFIVKVTRPREILDRRIARRVDREISDGLVAEVEGALDTEDVCREAMQIIGAKEVAAMRAGDLAMPDLPDRLAARTRRLVRKQLTWLKKMPVDAELDLGDAPSEDACEEVLRLFAGRER